MVAMETIFLNEKKKMRKGEIKGFEKGAKDNERN